MSMLKITAHAMIRYTERIKKEKVRNHDISNISQDKRDLYTKEITKMYEFSKLIYIGKFKDYKKSCFRLANDIMLITDTTGKVIITLFRVDFGLLNKKDNKKVEELILDELNAERATLKNLKVKMNRSTKDNLYYLGLTEEYKLHAKNYNDLAEKICYSVNSRIAFKKYAIKA